MTSDDDLIAEVEAVLASVEIVDEDSFRAAVEKLQKGYHNIRTELGKVIVGQDAVIEELLIALFCRGHALLVGVPGLAKTLLIPTSLPPGTTPSTDADSPTA